MMAYEIFFANFRVTILHFTGWSRHNAATASHIVTSHQLFSIFKSTSSHQSVIFFTSQSISLRDWLRGLHRGSSEPASVNIIDLTWLDCYIAACDCYNHKYGYTVTPSKLHPQWDHGPTVQGTQSAVSFSAAFEFPLATCCQKQSF